MSVLSEKLRELRNKNGYIQQAAADGIGISRIMLSNYERGIREPDLKTLCKIADYYDVSIDFLLGYCRKPIDGLYIDKDVMDKIWQNSIFLSAKSKNSLLEYIELLKLRDEKENNE